MKNSLLLALLLGSAPAHAEYCWTAYLRCETAARLRQCPDCMCRAQYDYCRAGYFPRVHQPAIDEASQHGDAPDSHKAN